MSYPPQAGTRVHTHAGDPQGGQIDWDSVWSDAVHTHESNPEGGAQIAGVDTDRLLSIPPPAPGVPPMFTGGYVTFNVGTMEVTTGLTFVGSVMASLEDDPSLDACWVSAYPSATAGKIWVKIWKPTASGDCTPVAKATGAFKTVHWVAAGV